MQVYSLLGVIVVKFLTLCARLAIRRSRPKIIAITGSVGKTTTKDMVAAILQEAGLDVRASRKSYNSVFGVPLSIFNLSSGLHNPFIWLYNFIAAILKIIIGIPNYIVLEVGLETPGDIANVVSWLKPDIAVITHLSKQPVHVEFFPNKEALYQEKVMLLKAVKPGGIALYDAKDSIQKQYLKNIPESVVKQPFNDTDIYIKETGIHYDHNNPIGTDVTISLEGKNEPFYIPETLGSGPTHSLITAIAITRALQKDIPVQTMRRAIASRIPTKGRMRILPGKKGSTIIDDSYNASPDAVREALQTLVHINKKKKIAVLGGMGQLGKESEIIHQEIGRLATSIADYVFILNAPAYGNIPALRHVQNTEEVVQQCCQLADDDTVFLCKGSQVARIEKIVALLLAPDYDPKQVLVRQERHWE